MRRKTGCWLIAGIILLLVLALAGGAFLWFNSRPAAQFSGPASPVMVTLMTPSSGDEVNLGDDVPVSAQAISPSVILKTELFADGQSLGAVTNSPENASWTWRALPAGIHTFYAVSSDSGGNVGQSQTVIVNVLPGNGLIQVSAQGGQTLGQVGASFGASSDQMAGANPNLDPSKPLQEGQPVQVPIPPGDGAGGGSGVGGGQSQPGSGGANGPVIISIDWSLKLNQQADQSYCYESSGNGEWDKMPQDPFTFFQGMNSLYTQLIPLAQTFEIQVQCWGWQGGALKYLGDGKTTFDASLPSNLVISAAGFQLTGTPHIPIPVQQLASNPKLVPPYAMREPTDAADCTAHSNPLLAAFICKTLLNGPKSAANIVVEWEWQPPFCWPGFCSSVVQAIDGYRLYAVDPVNKTKKFLKQINNPNQKIALLPFLWGESNCWGVQAFVNSPVPMQSGLTTYCQGKPPQAQKITFTPTAWATRGGAWTTDEDCSTTDYYKEDLQYHGVNINSPAVLVGSFIVFNTGCDLWQGDYSGAVKFSLASQPLPAGFVLQKAVLKFSTIYMEYGATHVALGAAPDSCVSGVGKALQDWSALNTGNHFKSGDVFRGPTWYGPIQSIGGYLSGLDVSSAVSNWIQHPDQNRGFILKPTSAPLPMDVSNGGGGTCLSFLGNFALDVYYFAP